MSSAQPVIKRLDHLGLIAAFCHEVGLPGIIDRVIPKYSDHNVSHGDAVLAMILNGLGFHSRTLHMFSDFFETKPVAKLLAKDIEAHHLTDDVLGRTLDALYEADVSALYQAIAEHVVDKLGLKTDSVHLDITSFHVDGEYAQDEDLNAIKLVKGYSRDHRPELNQVVLELICENQAGLPVYMQALSGNTNDAKAFSEVTKRHIHCLKAAQNSRYFIADAALYTEESIRSLDEQQQKFITRVPMTIKSAKEALMNLEPEQLSRIGNGYSGCWVDADYGSVSQKWLLVHSEQATKREEATFYKNLDKNITKELKALGQLMTKKFACGYDAADPLNILNDEAKMTPLASAEPAWMSHATVRDGSIVRLATQAQQIDMVAGSEIGYLGLNESCDNPKGVIQEDYRVHIECFSQEKPPQFFQKMIPDQLKLIDGSDATGVISIKNPFVKKVTQFVVAEQGGTFKAEDFDDEQHPGKLSKYLNERRHYLERLFVKHPSEWFKAVGCEHHENTQRHNLSFMDFIYAQSFRLGTYMESLFRKNYLLPNHQHFCAHEKTRIEMLSWLQDASDLGLTKTLWHLYPLELGWRGFYITREQMAQMFPTQDNTLKARRELVRHLFNEYSDAFEIDNAEKAAQFFAQVKAEVGVELRGTKEDLTYKATRLSDKFSRYFGRDGYPDEADRLGYKGRISSTRYQHLSLEEQRHYTKDGSHYYKQVANRNEIAKRVYSCSLDSTEPNGFVLIQGGDQSGLDYMGKGFIQLTWIYNYNAVQKRLENVLGDAWDVNIVDNPNILIEDVRAGFLSALGYWLENGLNELSGDSISDTNKITDVINLYTDNRDDRTNNFLLFYKIINS